MTIKIKLNNSQFTKELLSTYSQVFPDINKVLNPYIPDINNLMETGILSDNLQKLLNSNNFQNRSLGMYTMPLRFEYVKLYGFNLLNDKFLQACQSVIKDDKIIELGAGTGFLTMKLKELKLNIEGLEKEQSRNKYGLNHQYTTLIKEDAIPFLEKNGNEYNTVILSWPNQDSDFALKTLQIMHTGQKLLYIGERIGGCTATDEFFELLGSKADILIDETKKLQKNYTSWQGIYDRPELFVIK